MKIFIVGGAGYIGSVCSELLLNEGHEVAIFDNLSEGHRAAVDSRTHFIEGELADRQQIEAALSTHRPDAVMHFAANDEDFHWRGKCSLISGKSKATRQFDAGSRADLPVDRC